MNLFAAPPPDPIADAALRLITTARRRWAPDDLINTLASRFETHRRVVRKAVNRLVQSGEVQYTYEFGCSFLVPSVNRPVAVSPRVILSPPGFDAAPAAHQVVVILSHGAAFGTGSHPTTRLAVRAVDEMLAPMPPQWRGRARRVLDVGTGSGVLLLAALKLGMAAGIGLDLDPCAVSESRANAEANGLGAAADFADRPLQELQAPFQLITANLRMPTLLDMAASLTGLADRDAGLVISGIREDESAVVGRRYRQAGWQLIREETDTGWAGQAYRRQRA